MNQNLTATKPKKHHKHSTKKHKSKVQPIPLNEGQILPYETPDCGQIPNQPEFACKFVCLYDPQCQVLGWNRTTLSCGCGAQICQNMLLYGFPSYTEGEPLYDSQIAFQPHVTASCNCTVPAEIAPYHRAIYNDSCDGGNGPSAQVTPPTQVTYNPSTEENPPVQGLFLPLSELLDEGPSGGTIQ